MNGEDVRTHEGDREKRGLTRRRAGPLEPELTATISNAPRLGFLGVGWIGRNRMEAVARSGTAEVAAIADSSADMLSAAGASVPAAARLASVEELLDADLDGIVIATPSALHAEQTLAALDRGLSVFCQKPLGRTADETSRVVDAARRVDRLLGVDLSYRFTRAARSIYELVRSGELGRVYVADLFFHNAYGPDKAWFFDPRLSGGGCVIDLGIHLADLALWILDFPNVEAVTSRLYAAGEPLTHPADRVEDYAVARLDLDMGATVQLTCSWRLPAGCDAVISATFYGTEGAAALRNLNGSFYDFVAERYRRTEREVLVQPPDDWGGRAIVDWAERLAAGCRYDPAVERAVAVAEVLDRIYRR